MTENELYELVADYGHAYGPALRRDIYLARGVDWPRTACAPVINTTRGFIPFVALSRIDVTGLRQSRLRLNSEP